MAVRLTERRRSSRVAAAHPVTVCDRGGRVLLRGRTANISECGLLCLTEARRALRLRGGVIVELTLPCASGHGSPSRACRLVRYAGRIVRTEEIGQLVGLGIELGERLG